MKTVVGLYDDYGQAKDTYQDLIKSNFDRQSISLISPNVESAKHLNSNFWKDLFGSEETSDMQEIDLPGIGRVAEAGPLTGEMTGQNVSLVDALVNRGVLDSDAQMFAEGVRRGGSLIVVYAEEPADQTALGIMRRYEPVDIGQRMGIIRQKENWQGFDETSRPLTPDERNKLRVPIIEEELKVGKRQVETGGARIHTYVTQEKVSQDINLRSERVNVEHHPADRPASPQEVDAFKEDTIEMRETAEEPVVSKDAHVVEDIEVTKNVDERTETVGDTVRRTHVDVENLGDGGEHAPADLDTFEPDFRRHYESHYTQSNMGYNQIRSAYRFGAERAVDDRFGNRDWSQAEPDLRSDWERNHPEMAWDRVKDAVSTGWEAVR